MSSLLPSFIDALVAAATAAAADGQPLDGLLVFDGPVMDGDSSDTLTIGATETPGEQGATTADGSDGNLPEFVIAEQLSVQCALICWSGDEGVSGTLRSRAYTYLDAIEHLLIPNAQGVTLGLAGLAWARIAGTTYTPRSEDESSVAIGITISAQGHPATR